MKKIIGAILFLLAGTFVFANVEIDTSFYGSVFNTRNLKFDSTKINLEGAMRQNFSFGMQDDFSFFFGSRASKFDAGLGLFGGIDWFSSVTDATGTYTGTGLNSNLGIGPVFRYTPSNSFSLFFRPAIGVNAFRFSCSVLNYDIELIDINGFLDLNIGGRSWLLNVNGFHLGLSYGVDFNFGGGTGSVVSKGYKVVDYDNNFAAMKIYFGACLNFGDRGFDRL